MNHRSIIRGAALAVSLALAGAAGADSFPAAPEHVSHSPALRCAGSLALPLVGAAPLEIGVSALSAPAGFSGPGAPRYEAVRYRPRHGGRSHGGPTSAPAQIHFGFFEPDGDGSTSFALGFRGGPAVDPHIQIGLGADWYRKSESRRVVAGDPYLQGNQLIRPERVLSRASSNLFPILAFMQVSGGDDLSVVPYFGVAGDYQLLLLSATDYQTGTDFDATFGGWGWQVWGGAAIPLSGQSRLFGELFVNGGEVEREVDASGGLTFRERVDTDGVGMRFGLSWGY